MTSILTDEDFVNAFAIGDQQYADITTLEDGTYVVAWQSEGQDGDGWTIVAQRYTATGAPIGTEVIVNTSDTGDQIRPKVSQISGGYVVTWEAPDGSGSGVYGQKYDLTGAAVGGEFLVNTQISSSQFDQDVVGLPDGGFVVTWYDSGNGTGYYRDARAQIYDASGVAVGAPFTVNTTGAANSTTQELTAVAAIEKSGDANQLVNGGFVVTYTSSSTNDVYVQRYAQDGTALGAEINVSGSLGTYPSDDAGRPAIAGLTGGQFVVVMTDYTGADGNSYGIFANVYNGDGTLVTVSPIQINQEFSSTQFQPAVVGLSDGTFAVVWSSNTSGTAGDGNSYGVFARVFAADGTALGDEIQVNDTILGNQSRPEVTALANGAFAVTWHTDNGDGDGWTIAQRILGDPMSWSVASANPELEAVSAVRVFLENTVNAAPQFIDAEGAVALSDADSPDFGGGRLVVSVIGYSENNDDFVFVDAEGQDVLGIGTTAAVSVAGVAVSVGGTVIGTVASDGTNGADLVVSFNTEATVARVEQLIEALTYQNLSDDPRPSTTLGITVEDGDGGGTKQVSVEIQITPEIDAEGAVTGDRRVNTYTTDTQDQSTVAGLADGGFLSVWTSSGQDGNNDGVYAQRYDASGNAVGAEFLVNTTTSNAQNDAAVTGLADGGWAIVWYDATISGIRMNRYDATGALSVTELQVETYTSSTQSQPTIAEMTNGDIVVAWSSNGADGSSYGISAQRFTSAGVAIGTEMTVNAQTTGSQTNPAITALAGGGFLVAWTEEDATNGDGSSYAVRARIVSSTGVFTPAADDIDVNTFTTNTQYDPAVATLTNGNVVVTWASYNQDGSGYGTYFRLFDATGTALTGEIRVNDDTIYDQQNPAVIALSTGGFVIGWDDYHYNSTDGYTWDVQAQVYGADGARIDGPIVLNQSTNGTQNGVALAALPDGNWVAQFTTQSGDEVGDSSGYAVINRIFGDAGEIFLSAAPMVSGLADLSVTESAANAGVAVFTQGVLSISDSDSADFDTGTLTIARVSTAGAEAQFSAPDNAAQDNFSFAAINGVTQAGTTLSVGGMAVATITSDGQDGAPLHLTFLPGATVAAVETLLATLRYVNASDDPQSARTFTFQMTDGDGGSTQTSDFSIAITPEVEASAIAAVTGDMLVNSYIPGQQLDSEVATLSDGGWVVVWVSVGQDGSQNGVYGQRYNADGSLNGGEFHISQTWANQQSDPVVTGLDNGGFAVSWSGNGVGDSAGVFTRVYDASGAAATSEALVNTTTGSTQENPSIVQIAGGYAVAWTSQSSSDDGSGYAVMVQRFDNAGVAQGSATQAYSAAGTNSTQYLSDMALLSNGNFVVTYASNGQDGSGYGVYASIFNASGVLQGTEFLVNTTTSGNQTEPAIAATTDGGFVISWTNQSGYSGYDVYAQRFDASGVAQGGEFRVNDGTKGGQYQSDVIGLSDGRFVVAFYDDNYNLSPNYGDVRYQLYSATGARIDGNVLINTQTVSTQQLPTLAALPNGNFVATWTSNDTANSEDSDGGGVYQMIFGNPADFDLTGAPILQGVEVTRTMGEAEANAGLVSLFEDQTVAVGDLDSADFDMGVLRLSFENGSADLDSPAPGEGLVPLTLGLIPGDVGNGAVSVSGAAVLVNGTNVGTITEDGLAGNAFAVTFNSNATQEAVEAVIGALGVQNTSDDPSDWMTFALNLSDGDGKSAGTEFVTVTFTPETDSTLVAGDESRVNSYAFYYQSEPMIAELTGGGHVVVWTTYQDDGTYDVRGQMYGANGDPVGQEFTVNTVTASHQYVGDVAATADGGFVVVYESNTLDSSGYGVAGQRYNADGTQNGSEFLINVTESGSQNDIRVSGFVDGGFVATWYSNGELYSRVFDAAGVGGAEAQVNGTVTSSTQHYPDVATLVDGGGNNAGYAVVFRDAGGADGDNAGVFLQRYDATGAKIGSEAQVNTYTASAQDEPKIVGLTGGGFVVTWSSSAQDGSADGVYAQMYDTSGAKLGTEFRVNDTTNSDQTDSDVTALADGGFVVTWYDANASRVAGQRYDATGAKVDGEFVVNQNTSGTQNLPAVASAGTGFAVVWTDSSNIDGSSETIMLRQYLPSGTDTSPVMDDLNYEVSLGADDVTAGPVVIDGGIDFSDPDNVNFAGGFIDVYDAGGGALTDQLSLSTAGTITLTGGSGEEVRINGVQVGTIDATFDGVNGNGLRITLLAAADAAAVELLLESLTYQSTDLASNIANTYRTLGILVTDGTGGQTEPDAIRIYTPTGTTVPTGFSGITDWNISGTTYSEQALFAAPVLLDTEMALTDVPGASYSGGYVRVQDVYTGNYYVQFSIWDEGTGTGQISVAGTAVSYEGTQIGTINATYDGDQQYLQIDLGVNATKAAVEALIEHLQFQFVQDPGGYTSTNLQLTVNNGSVTRSATSNLYHTNDYTNLAAVAGTGEAQVNLTTYQDQTLPQIAELTDGSYVVVWQSRYQDVPSSYDQGIYARIYSAEGNPLSGEIQINDIALGDQYHPQIAALSNGHFVVSWTELDGRDGSGAGVFAQVLDATGTDVGAAFQINEEVSNSQHRNTLTATSGGGFVAVWSSTTSGSAGDGSGYGIFGRVFGADGASPTAEFQINTTTSGSQTAPAAVTLAGGDIIVVWEDQNGADGNGYGIFAQRISATGALLSFDGLSLGADEQQINTYTSNTQNDAAIAALDGGGFVVVWTSNTQDGQNDGVYAQVYDAAGAMVGSEIQVNQTTDSYQNDASVVSDGAGGFYVTWTDDSSFSSGADIVGRRFDATGSALGDQFKINEETSSTQYQSAVELLSSGALVVAWSSSTSGTAGDGSTYGVFKTTLNAPPPSAGAGSPVLDGFDDTVTFAESDVNAGLHLLNTDATLSVTDADSSDFNGGYLILSHDQQFTGLDDQMGSNEGVGQDVLGVVVGAGVTVSGADILVDAVLVGTIDATRDGTGGQDLRIDFNAAATLELVERVVAQLGYANPSSTPSATRSLTLTLTDGDGGGVTKSVTVNVTAESDTTIQPLGGEEQVNSYTAGEQNYPESAAIYDATGTQVGYVTTWLSYDQDAPYAGNWGMFAQMFALDGTPVGPEILVNETTLNAQNGNAVVGLPTGGFVVAYNSGSDVWGRIFDGNGQAQGGEFPINDITSSTQNDTALAAKADGTIVAVYTDQSGADGNGYGVFMRLFDNSGAALGGSVRVNDTVTSTQENAAVTVLSGGQTVVTWQSYSDGVSADGSYHGVFAKIYDATGAVAVAEFQVNTVTTIGNQSQPVITALNDGSFVIVFTDQNSTDGSGYSIWQQQFAADGTLIGDQVRVNETTSSNQYDPQVTALDGGGWVVVWQDDSGADGSGSGVFAQLYDASGARLDGEFQVNTEYSSTQQFPTVVALPGGGFSISWASYTSGTAGDGSSYGIFQQVYGPTGSPASVDPLISGLAATMTLAEADANLGVTLFPALGVGDSDSVNFDGGQLTVYMLVDPGVQPQFGAPDNAAQDNFALSSAGSVSVAGGVVSVGGTAVATVVSDGQNGAALTLAFTANATAASVEAILEALTYTNASDDPAATRYLQVQLTDGDGGAFSAQTVVTITPEIDGLESLGVETQANSYTDATQSEPAITTLADGRYVVVWHSNGQDGSSYGIFGQLYDASGVPVGAEFQVNTTASNNQQFPSVVGLDTGGFAVAWTDYSGQTGNDNQQEIVYRLYDANGAATSGEIAVDAANDYNPDTVSLTAFTDAVSGNFLITYEANDSSTGQRKIAAQVVNDAGGFVGAGFDIEPVGASDTGAPDAATQADGTFMIAYQAYNLDASNTWGVYVQRFAADRSAIGAPIQVNAYVSDHQYEPAIAALENGTYVVTWRSQNQDGSGAGVYAQILDASGAKVGAEVLVNDTVASDQFQPDVVGIPGTGGGFAITYTDWYTDGDGYAVVLQQYDASGNRVDGPILVNEYTTSYQYEPAITALPNGSLVVSYASYQQDGSDYGVYTQIIGDPALVAANANPVLEGVNAQVSYEENVVNAIPQLIDANGAAAVSDADSADFDGGSLIVSSVISAVALIDQINAPDDLTQDQYGLRQGARISIAGTAVSVDGTQVASIVQTGTGGAPFEMVFNTNATAESVELLVENLTYRNISDDPIETRNIRIQLTDGDGGAADPVLVEVSITPNQDAATARGGEVSVNTTVTGNDTQPDMVGLPGTGGDFVMVWYANGDILGQRFDNLGNMLARDGTGLPSGTSDEFTVTAATGTQTDPSIAAFSDGSWIVVWEDQSNISGGNYEIVGQRFNADGTLAGTATVLNELPSGYQYRPDVTVLSGDRFVVTWDSASSGVNDGSGYGVLYQVFEATGVPLAAGQRVANTTTSGNQLYSMVTALNDGGFLVTWVDESGADGSGQGVYAQRFDVDGVAVGSEFLVNSLTAGTQNDVSVTTLSDGNLVFTWVDHSADLSSQGVYAQIYDVTGAPVTEQFRVNDRTTSTQYQPEVQALNNGGFVIAWSDNGGDGSSYGIYAQQYDADGSRLDSQFLVNTTTSGNQTNPVIAALAAGGFAIGWQGSIDVQVFGNDIPTNSPVSAAGQEDVALVLDAAIFDAGFNDPDGNPLQAIRINTFPSNGTLTLSGVAVSAGQEISRADLVAGNLVYLGNQDYNGPDSFEWSGSDGIDFASSSVLANITLAPVNDAPGLEAGADTSVGEGGTVSRQLTLTDPDVQNRTFSIDWGDGSAAQVFASTSLTPNTAHTYGAEGSYTVTVTVDDGAGAANSVEVDTYTVTVVNADPNAVGDSVYVSEDGPAVTTGNVLTNDSDPGGDSLVVSAVNGNPANLGVQITTTGGGLVTVNPDGTFSYDPNGAFEALDDWDTGYDSFTYTISDGEGGTDTATVQVYIDGQNDDPIAVDDPIPVTDDTAVTGNLLANDTDVDASASLSMTQINGAPFGVGAFTLPSGALLTVDAAGNYTYDPNGQFPTGGTDSFTYTVIDGRGGSDTGTATVTITSTQSPPDAVDDSFATDEDTLGNFNVLTNDSDADGDPLSVTLVNGAPGNVGVGVTLAGGAVVTLTSTGALSVNPNGQYEDLGVGETATESFTYTISDGQGGADTATVDITITGVNDDPNAVNDGAITDEDTATAGNVLTNDTDIDGDALAVSEVGGSTLAVGMAVTGATGGAFTIAANGDWTYDPGAAHQDLRVGQTTTDWVQYTVSDGLGGTDTTVLSVTVTGVNDAPTAVDDGYTVAENATLSGLSLIANDTDPDTGDSPVVWAVNGATTIGSQITLASGALLVVNASGTFTYDPNGQFDGLQNGETATDSFTYAIQDGSGVQDTATATITITGVSSTPVAVDDAATTDEDTATLLAVLDNDSDADLDPLSVTLIDGQVPVVGVAMALSSGALVTLNADGTIAYDPNGQFESLAQGDSTTDSFVYQISDGNGGFTTATATVTITGANDNPDARNDLIGTNEDTVATDTLFANNGFGVDSDIDAGDSFTVTAVNGAAVNVGAAVALAGGGLLTVAANGAVSFDPAGHYDYLAVGEHTDEVFTYTVTDSQGGTDTATVTVAITGVNDQPDAVDDLFNVAVDIGLSGNVLAANGGAADSDPDASDTLAVATIQGGTSFGVAVATDNGGLVTMAANGSFTYDQNGAFSGLGVGVTATDTFTYTISDGHGGVDTATVTITIGGTNLDPVAVADSATTDEETPLSLDLAANDTDGNGDSLSVVSVDDTGVLGTVTLNGDGSVSYDPNGQFETLGVGQSATETFTYVVSDGNGGSDMGTVTITVTGVNDQPVAMDDSGFVTDENTVLNTSNVLANDSDIDGDTLVVSSFEGTSAQGGTVSYLGAGVFSYDPTAVLQGLGQGDSVVDTFTYTVSDGHGGSDTATVSITVNGVNDDPTALDDGGYTTDEDTALTISDALANDTDPEGDTLTVSSFDAISAYGASVTQLITGEFVYDPTVALNALGVGQSVVDTFTYTISDGNSGADTATVSITVTGVNDDPTAYTDTLGGGFDEDTAATIAAASLLGNDTDPDSPDVLTILSVDAVSANGVALTLNLDGSVTWDPTGVLDGLAASDTIIDTFTYTISDGHGGTDTATVQLTVNGVNDDPTAVDDGGAGYSTTKDSGLTGGSVLGNDNDIDGDSLTIQSYTQPTLGAVVMAPDGTFTYDPQGQFASLGSGDTATETFTYTVSDGNGGVDTATVTIVITGANLPVAAVDDSGFTTDEDTAAVTTNVLLNDSDGDGDPLTVSTFDAVSSLGAAVSYSGGGIFAYDPTAALQYLAVGDSVVDTFTYTITDGNGSYDTATVSFTVSGVNDDPVAVADGPFATDEDTPLTTGNVLANDSDIDGDTLSVAFFDSASAFGATVSYAGGGVFVYDPTVVLQGLAAGATVTDTFSYVISDGNGGSDTLTASILVTGVNDQPTAVDDSGTTTDEDTAVTIGSVLANDTDPDGDTLTVATYDAVSTLGAAVSSLGAGQFVYDPTAALQYLAVGESVTDTFTYTISDGQGGSDTATVSVTVTGLNDQPTAVDDDLGAGFDEDTAATIAAASLLANDTDPDTSDTLVILSVDAVSANGVALTLNLDGSITWDPTGVLDDLALGDTLVDSFTYTISDGHGGTDTATAQLTVAGVNDDPVAFNDSYTVAEDTPLVVAAALGVLANDGDVDGDGLSVSLVSGVANGVLTLNPDGSFSYTANADWFGTDSFVYQVADGNGGMDQATVSIDVTPVNDAPVFTSATAFTVPENTTAVTTLTATDVEGDPLSYAITGGADAALFTVDATTGALSFVAAPDYEAPGDVGADNVYDLLVSVFDGTDTTTQALTVTVTNEPEQTPIYGTTGQDFLLGSAADEIFYTFGGNDMIVTGDGADVVVLGNYNFHRDFVVIKDFDLSLDALDIGGRSILYSASANDKTLLILSGDLDTVLLYGIEETPTIL